MYNSLEIKQYLVKDKRGTNHRLTFTRYCYYQYCMVCGIQKGGRGGGRILPNGRAILLQQCGQCRRAGRMKERLIRVQTITSRRMSCKGPTIDVRSPPSVSSPTSDSPRKGDLAFAPSSVVKCLWDVFVWGVVLVVCLCVCRCRGCCSLSVCVCVTC